MMNIDDLNNLLRKTGTDAINVVIPASAMQRIPLAAFTRCPMYCNTRTRPDQIA